MIEPSCHAFNAGIFGILLHRVFHIATQSKAVRHALEELYVVDVFLFVHDVDRTATELFREGLVDLRA